MRHISVSPEAVNGRRQAIEALSATGLTNRQVAAKLGCSIWTVRYWLNPATRAKRIAYKAKARAKYTLNSQVFESKHAVSGPMRAAS